MYSGIFLHLQFLPPCLLKPHPNWYYIFIFLFSLWNTSCGRTFRNAWVNYQKFTLNKNIKYTILLYKPTSLYKDLEKISTPIELLTNGLHEDWLYSYHTCGCKLCHHLLKIWSENLVFQICPTEGFCSRRQGTVT